VVTCKRGEQWCAVANGLPLISESVHRPDAPEKVHGMGESVCMYHQLGWWITVVGVYVSPGC
jgi:hypothetical protein